LIKQNIKQLPSRPKQNSSKDEKNLKDSIRILNIFAAFAVFFAAIYWILSSGQPIVDRHEFRQSQTALTTYFLEYSWNGILKYETPVVGFPWAIPFEFPSYQLIVGITSKLSSVNIVQVGRLVSASFSALTIWPSVSILHFFGVRKVGVKAFLLLYFSSAVYLYWSRSFMIESLALFLGLVSLSFYINSFGFLWINSLPSIFSTKKIVFKSILFTVIVSVSLLTKATTALPIYSVFIFDLLYKFIALIDNKRSANHFFTYFYAAKRLAPIVCSLSISFLLLLAWLHHADSLKSLNDFAIELTSNNLRAWNYGELTQRFSFSLWVKTLVFRVFTLLGLLGLCKLVYDCILLQKCQRGKYYQSSSVSCNTLIVLKNLRTWIVNPLAVFFVLSAYLLLFPLLVFTNLHITHDYYQFSCQIYFYWMISASLSWFLVRDNLHAISVSCLRVVFLVAIGGYINFAYFYLPPSFLSSSSRLAIGNKINSSIPPDSSILVIGDDWSSAFSFHARRRGLALRDYPYMSKSGFNYEGKILNVLGKTALGAIVYPSGFRLDSYLQDICKAKTESMYPTNEQSLHASDHWKLRICES